MASFASPSKGGGGATKKAVSIVKFIEGVSLEELILMKSATIREKVFVKPPTVSYLLSIIYYLLFIN